MSAFSKLRELRRATTTFTSTGAELTMPAAPQVGPVPPAENNPACSPFSASRHGVQGDPATGFDACVAPHETAGAEPSLYDQLPSSRVEVAPQIEQSCPPADLVGTPCSRVAGRVSPQSRRPTGHELVLSLVDEAIAAWRRSLKSKHRGRPPRWVWEEHRDWIAVVANRLARTNAADRELSMTEAVWGSLDHPLTPAGFAESLRRQRTRYSYAPSLRAILRYIGARIITVRGRDRDELERGLTGRGFLRRHWSEQRRLRAGERISFDDGSINLVLWVDWPWGGAGKVAERWGCIVGRFQLLLCEDAGTGFLPGYAFVARPLGSYRAEDALGAIARMARYQVKPDQSVLEQATWASHAIKDFHRAAGIDLIHTYSPKHKLVETAFNRLWGRMAPDERVSLGRFRGDDEAGTALWTKLRAGTVDPRLHCQSLAEVVALLDRVIGRANTEPISSKTYGSWVPAHRWAQDLHDFPRGRLADDLWWAWAPVRRDLVVTGSGVSCRCADVLGESWEYSFAWPNVHLYRGKHVRVCFDPAADPCRAAIVLLENSPATFEKAGTVITHHAEATCKIPLVMPGRVDWDGGEIERTRAIRAAQRNARQWIFRAFSPDGRTVHTAESELRSPTGEIVAATHASRNARPIEITPRVSTPTIRPEVTDDELAAIERAERRAQQSLIPTGAPPLI